MSVLPVAGPLSRYARARDPEDVDAFVGALPGRGVFVRIDERGGDDEPVPWAFPRTLGAITFQPSHDVDVYARIDEVGDEESTATSPPQGPLPVPVARERATVIVVPHHGGVIGRAADVAIRVRERSVSRRHATLDVDGAVLLLRDLHSDNGVCINGMAVVSDAPTSLRSGDVVTLGDVACVYLSARDLWTHLPALTNR